MLVLASLPAKVQSCGSYLLENDLGAIGCVVVLGGGDLLDALGGIESCDVQNVLVGRCVNKVDLGAVWVSVSSSSGWRDEDRSREVVAKNVYSFFSHVSDGSGDVEVARLLTPLSRSGPRYRPADEVEAWPFPKPQGCCDSLSRECLVTCRQVPPSIHSLHSPAAAVR